MASVIISPKDGTTEEEVKRCARCSRSFDRPRSSYCNRCAALLASARYRRARGVPMRVSPAEAPQRVCPDCSSMHRRPKSERCAACASRAASRAYYHSVRGKSTVARRRQSETPAEEAARNARAYLAVYMARPCRRCKRRVVPALCAECGCADTKPYQPNLRNPLHVVWFCARHLAEQDAPHLPAPSIAQRLAALEPLRRKIPPGDLRAIEAAASGGRLDSSSPLYRSRLVGLLEQYVKSRTIE